MLCILCVTTSERTLHIFQSEGISLRIREIIVKHFWLQPNAEDENTQVICMSCWKALDSFHKFYEQVEQAHIKLQSIKFSEINELKQENEPLHRISKDDSEEFVEIEPELLNADIKLEVQEGAVFTLPNIIRMDRSQSFESKLTSTSNSRDRMPLEKSSYIGNTTNNEIQTEISSSTAVWNSSRESFKSKSEEDVDVPTTESRKCNRVLRERRKLGPEDTDRKSTHRLRKSVTQKKVENSNLLPNNDEHAKIMDDDIVNVLKRKRSTSQESIDVQNSTSSTGENDRLVGFQNTTNESSTNFVTDPILADSGPECTEPNSDNDDDSDYNDCPSTEKKWRKAPKVGKRRGRPRNVNCNNQSEDKISSASDRSKKTSKIREYDEIITKNMKLMCTICIVEFANFAALKRHYRTTHNECGYVICCGKKFRKRGVLVDHIYTHQDPEYFKCVKCGRVLANRKGLDCHMLTHNAEKQRIYQCDQCTMSFYTKPLLTRHLQTHISERNIKCPECDKFFSTQDILRTHINNVHNDAYTRICDQCGKSFRRLDTFRRHQLEHDGVAQPLVTCEKCGVKLTSKYGLKRHMESMHPKTQVTHVCNTCGKIAPSAAALQRHISYMHKMERKYKCPMCDKAFKKTGGLKEHMSTHTGEVLYTCPHCPKTFNSNANMHSHRKKMHRKEWEENRRYPHMVAASQINRLEQVQ